MLRLTPGRHRALDGHLWIWRSEIADGLDQLADGALVQVVDAKGRVVGCGFHSARSQIVVRLLTRTVVDDLDTLLLSRLDNALAHRVRVAPGRAACRLVNSEGDLLPGLIVDRFADRLVIQCTTVGMDQRLGWWVDRLRERLSPTQVVERNDLPVRVHEGLPSRAGVLFGRADTDLEVAIGRVPVQVDLLDPHKTGAYLDQQEAHEALATRVQPGDRVLDCFCHLGGFGLHAALAGAGQVVAVDQAETAIAAVQRTAMRLGCAERVTAVAADAFDWLAQADRATERFDVVVLDPPSFTRNRAGVEGAMRGYHELHRRGVRLCRPGGVLATFSCSHHIEAAAFLADVVTAAAEQGRTLRLDAQLSQAADHPILPAIPETHYLKGFVFTVL